MRRKVGVLRADQRHPELDALWALITEAGAMQWKSATLTEMITVGLGIKSDVHKALILAAIMPNVQYGDTFKSVDVSMPGTLTEKFRVHLGPLEDGDDVVIWWADDSIEVGAVGQGAVYAWRVRRDDDAREVVVHWNAGPPP